MQVFVWMFPFVLGKYLGVEWLHHWVVGITFDSLNKLPNCVPKLFLSTLYDSFSSSILSPIFGMVSLLNFSHSNRNITISYFGLISTFLMSNYVEHLFMLFAICISSLSVCMNLLPISKLSYFLIIIIEISLHFLKISLLQDKSFIEIFPLGYSLSFHSSNDL